MGCGMPLKHRQNAGALRNAQQSMIWAYGYVMLIKSAVFKPMHIGKCLVGLCKIA